MEDHQVGQRGPSLGVFEVAKSFGVDPEHVGLARLELHGHHARLAVELKVNFAPSDSGVAYLFPLGQDQLLSVIFLLKVTRISFVAGSTSVAPDLGLNAQNDRWEIVGDRSFRCGSFVVGLGGLLSGSGVDRGDAAIVGSTGADVEAAEIPESLGRMFEQPTRRGPQQAARPAKTSNEAVVAILEIVMVWVTPETSATIWVETIRGSGTPSASREADRASESISLGATTAGAQPLIELLDRLCARARWRQASPVQPLFQHGPAPRQAAADRPDQASQPVRVSLWVSPSR